MRSKICMLLVALFLPFMAAAEVNWVFQVGGWYANQYGGRDGVSFNYDYQDGQRRLVYDKNGNLTLAVGMYLQINLSKKMPLFLETGLGYRNKPILSVEEGYKFDPSDKSLMEDPNSYTWGFGGNLIEIPVKAGYRLKLNDSNAFEFGLGPYMSFCISDNDGYGDKFSVGATASVVFRHRCMSFGVSYLNPLFKNGMRDYHKNDFLFTIGINFGTSSWNNIGNAMLIAGQVAGGMADTYNSYNSYSGGGYGGTASYDSDSYSSSSSSHDYQSEYDKWARLAERHYNSITNTGYTYKDKNGKKKGSAGGSMSSGNYTSMKKSYREAQEQMKKIRQKAAKAGVTIRQSEWETRSISY